MKKIWVLSIVAFFMLAASLLPFKTSGHQQKFRRSVKPVSSQYIVVLNDKYVESDASIPVIESEAGYLTSVYGGQTLKIYESALKGFAVRMSEAEALALSKDDRVLYVEEDAEISVATTELNAPWNLDRIDQQNLPLNTTYDYSSTGSGVNVYVIDTGIRPTHIEFGGRASVAYDALSDGQNGLDCNGHGTHVAGTIGSATYGVAKEVTLRGVRVLPCAGSGQVSDLLSGVNWVSANRINPAVANISITVAGISSALDTAITNSIASGVTYAIAAGNYGADACTYSPARVPNAITVGATTDTDARAAYSNYGTCVDVLAPGSNVLSLSNSSDTGIRTLSGTSMASPVVAGIAALYLGSRPDASPAAVAQAIRGSATAGVLSNVDSSTPNLLVNSWLGAGPSPSPTPTPAPTVTPAPTPAPQPARITIRKRAVSTSGGTSSTVAFPYQATNIAASNFSLVDNTQFVDSNVSQSVVTVSEAQVLGWALSSIQCVETSTGLPNSQNTTVDMQNRRANIIAEPGEDVTCTFTSQQIAPTAARASVSGRAVDANGLGVRGVTIYIYNASGSDYRTAITNGFGFYGFTDLPVGNFYILGVQQRRRSTFNDNIRSFTLNEDTSDINFLVAR